MSLRAVKLRGFRGGLPPLRPSGESTAERRRFPTWRNAAPRRIRDDRIGAAPIRGSDKRTRDSILDTSSAWSESLNRMGRQ